MVNTRINKRLKKTTINFIQQMVEQQRQVYAPGSRRHRKTTEHQDQFLRLLALRNRHQSTRKIGKEYFAIVGRLINIQTIVELGRLGFSDTGPIWYCY